MRCWACSRGAWLTTSTRRTLARRCPPTNDWVHSSGISGPSRRVRLVERLCTCLKHDPQGVHHRMKRLLFLLEFPLGLCECNAHNNTARFTSDRQPHQSRNLCRIQRVERLHVCRRRTPEYGRELYSWMWLRIAGAVGMQICRRRDGGLNLHSLLSSTPWQEGNERTRLPTLPICVTSTSTRSANG